MSSIKPLVLHAHSTGPNPIKVAIALQYLQVPYEVKQWQFGDDAENGVKGTRFLQINENGRVPALEDPNTGVVSWESGACMNYVRRVYDKAGKLGPVSNAEQDIVDFEKWEYFLLTTLGPMLGQTNWFRYVSVHSELERTTLRDVVTTMRPRMRMPWEDMLPRAIGASMSLRSISKRHPERAFCQAR